MRKALTARLSAVELGAWRRWRWYDRAVSMWAPIVVLAIAAAVYTALVESAPCAADVLQPMMQTLLILLLAWWVLLGVVRIALPGWNARRSARYSAAATLHELFAIGGRGMRKGARPANVEGALNAAKTLVTQLGGEASFILASTERIQVLLKQQWTTYRGGIWNSWGASMGRWLVFVALLRTCIAEPFKIPSGSMIPTLEIGDQVFVNKLIYGIRIPFVNIVPFVILRPPRRGDVVVFNNPANTDVDYIKRVIGEPGDRLDFEEEGVRVNGELLSRTLVTRDFTSWESRQPANEPLGSMFNRWFTNDWQALPNGTLYLERSRGVPFTILEDPERALSVVLPTMATHSLVVPQGMLFVMGDNRNRSDDSRFGLGDHSGEPRYVPLGNVKGKATIIWLSLAHGGVGSSIFGGTGLRFARFFRPVTMCADSGPRLPDQRTRVQ